MNDSWQEKTKNPTTYESGDIFFTFEKGSGSALQCVSGSVVEGLGGLYVFLKGSGASGCEPS